MVVFYISVATENIEDAVIIKTVPASRSFQSTGMLRKPNTVPFGLLLWVLWSRTRRESLIEKL